VYLLALSYALMGCAWAAMLSMPFTILTNALSGGNIGTYLGLFNCTITVPQIVAALCGGAILHCFPLGRKRSAAHCGNACSIWRSSSVGFAGSMEHQRNIRVSDKNCLTI